MSKRTAQQIRTYCKAATGGPWGAYHLGHNLAGGRIGHSGYGRQVMLFREDKRGPIVYDAICACETGLHGRDEANAEMISKARTDLPRVLNAAVALWRARYTDREMILRQAVANLAEPNDMELSEGEIRQMVLDDQLLSNFAWLEEGE